MGFSECHENDCDTSSVKGSWDMTRFFFLCSIGKSKPKICNTALICVHVKYLAHSHE